MKNQEIPVIAPELVQLIDNLSEDISISDEEAFDKLEQYISISSSGFNSSLMLKPGMIITDLAAINSEFQQFALENSLQVSANLGNDLFSLKGNYGFNTGIVDENGSIVFLDSFQNPYVKKGTSAVSITQYQKALFGSSLGNFFMGLINNVKRKRRNKRFKENYDASKPLVLIEGDSWVLYPWKLRDFAEYLSTKMNVYSIGSAGDELDNMVNKKEYLQTLKWLKTEYKEPEYFIFSGGGNDILGPTFKKLLTKYTTGYGPGENPERFLKLNCSSENQTCLPNTLKYVTELYKELINDLDSLNVNTTLLLHGYDYAEPWDKGMPTEGLPLNSIFKSNDWLIGPLTHPSIGIEVEEDQDGVIKVLIDEYNTHLENFVQLIGGNVHFVNVRGKVKQDWANEIHPNNSGFERVGKVFEGIITKAPIA